MNALQNHHEALAEAKFQELKAHYPRDPQLLTSIGAALDGAGNHHGATPWYRAALLARPGYPPAESDLALNYLAQGLLAEAVPLLESALQRDPTNLRSQYNLGLVELKLKRYKEAAGALRQSAEMTADPEAKQQIRVAEATALLNLKRYREAVDVLSPASNATTPAHLLLLGSAEALAGDLPTAIQTLQTAAKRFPSEPAAYYRLALVLSLGGRNQDAREALSTGLAAMPSSALLWYGQAVIDEAIGLYEDGVRAAQKSLEHQPGQADAWGLLGSLDVRLARMDDAVEAYRQALSYGADVHIRVNYAECLIRLRRFDEAERLLAQLKRDSPHDAEVNRGVGKLYRAEGDFSKAEPALQRAVLLDPNDSEAHYALAETLRHLGRIEAAKKEYAAFERTKNASRMVRLLVAG
jgi:tetratricopeptide (TPR) repeat protein